MNTRKERMAYIHELAQNYPRPSVRGYLYIVVSSTFPDFCKVGKSIDLANRITQYNSYNPYKTYKFDYISNVFDDYTEAEEYILEELRRRNILPKCGLEWFDVSYKETIKDLIISISKRPIHKRLLY